MTASMQEWTFGLELEFGDWPTSRELPAGLTMNFQECTQVNSTGIANDPTRDPARRLYHWGGEANTAPTDTIDGQIGLFETFLERMPEARVTHRCALQPHIRVPGLQEDLPALKRIAVYNAAHLKAALDLVDPLPTVDEMLQGTTATGQRLLDERLGAAKFSRRRHNDRRHVLDRSILYKQLAAQTPEEFFAAEVPKSREGRPQWHLALRQAMNLRQLMQTDTVEFRHFPGTLDPKEVESALSWCVLYLMSALSENDLTKEVLMKAATENISPFPRDVPYDHCLEQRFWATCHGHGNSRETIAANIARIEAGEFDNYHDRPRRLPL